MSSKQTSANRAGNYRNTHPKRIIGLKPGTYQTSCDRCGVTRNSTQIMEEWTGLLVCSMCFDNKHPLLDEADYVTYETDFPESPRPIIPQIPDQCAYSGGIAIPGFLIPGCCIPGNYDRFGTKGLVPSDDQ